MEVTENCAERMLLHCAKHSGREVIGALVRTDKGLQAIPLFHSRPCAPLLEVALQMMAQFELVGFYQGCIKAGEEIAKPNKLLELLCPKAAESGRTKPVVVCIDPESPEVYSTYRWENGFRKTGDIHLPAAPTSIPNKEIYDFDDHFENVDCDWLNPHLD